MDKIICIIPARYNSKRIKNKNIIKIKNLPLIAHVIKNLKKSKCFEDIFVSTDSEKIKKISVKYGAKAPFRRSKKLSDDYTGIHKVVKDAINKLKTEYRYKYICYIFPTAIMVNHELIKKYLRKFISSNKDFSINVREFNHPIERGFKINNNRLNPVNSKKFQKRTQDFSKTYYDTGEIYFAKKNSFLKKKLFDSKICFIKGQSNHIDLDKKSQLVKLKKLYLKK